MRGRKLRQAPAPLLSHLDLMTCGLGGGLVLLFVVLAVQKTAGVFDRGMSRPRTESESMSPFAIIVYSNRGQPLLNDAVQLSPWKLTGLSDEFGEAVNDEHFGLLHAANPPPLSAKIELVNLSLGDRLSVSVFHLGHRRSWSFDATKSPEQVWPLPMEGLP